jgi:hypothetical protein
MEEDDIERGVFPRDNRVSPLYDCEDELNFLDAILDNTKHALYIDARILFEGQPLDEQILKLGRQSIDTINWGQRRIINGVYCPEDKSKFIAGLQISPNVKELLHLLNTYIESLPSSERRQGTVKYILTNFEEAGWLEGLHQYGLTADDFRQLITETFSEYFREEKEHHSRIEAGAIQRNNFLLNQITEALSRWKQQLPAFLNGLKDEHRERYKDIIKRTCETVIPVTKEEPGLYKGIITDFGTIAGNIIKSVIDPGGRINVTISRLADNQEIISILKKLPSSDLECVNTFSKKQGNFFNRVRHPDIQVSFVDFFSFVKDTQAILDIFVKNKHLFA